MKNSNTVWLGSVPATWKISRIGSVYTLRNTKVSDKDYEPLSVTMNGIVPQLESAAKTNAHDDRKLVKKGDFAINSRSDRRGSCGIADRDGSVSLINTILCPNGEMNPRYYNWLFHTTQFADEFYANGHGIVDDLWTTGWQEMKRILIPLPPLEVQKSIANFLDQKCSEIDSLSADIQSQIDVLEEYKKTVITEAVTKGLNPDAEMKDSGIEWIGMVPAHWAISRIKFVTTCRDSERIPVDKNLRNDGLYPYWGAGSIMDYIDKYIFDDDIVLLGEDGAPFFDKTRNVAHHITYKCWINNHIHVLQSIPHIMSNGYLTHFLNIVDYGSYINGSILNKLTQGNMNEIRICLPSVKEQESIAKYLDAKCAEVDAVIVNKKAQLETLTEYKNSLIYEYVTGKKEVIQ